MKLTKSKLKQLIKEELENVTEDESGGKIRIQARLRTDDAFKAAQEETEARGAGQNTYQMAEYVVTLPDGEEIVIPDNQTFENMQDRERAIRDAFTMASGLSLKIDKRGYNLPSEESKIEGFTGISLPGGFDENGNLFDREIKDFQVFIDGFEIPKQGAASDELIKAFKKYKGKKPTYRSYKSTDRGPSKRQRYYDTYKEMPGRGYDSGSGWDRRNFKEGKLTKSVLKQMIREQLEEKPSGPLHEAYYAMRDFVDNLRDEALQEKGIDLADDLFDAIHDVMPFADRD
jgi:hypothetical protein